MKFLVISVLVCSTVWAYDSDPSGYGDNDESAVKSMADASPRNKPTDYTNNGQRDHNEIGNKKAKTNLVQAITGFLGANVGVLQGNNVQFDYNKYAPKQPNLQAILGNKFDLTSLGQTNQQGQSNTQVGGAQTNVGSNANTINVGQTNNQGGAGQAGYQQPRPSYDARYTPAPQTYVPQVPSYAGAGAGAANLGNIFANNKLDLTSLSQANQQGQSNTQVGGEQTNVGSNANAINIGQTNQQGGSFPQPSPVYDASKYVPIHLLPSNPGHFGEIVKGNTFDLTSLGQVNTQGQNSVQMGGEQTNVGQNQNAINVGQTNQQGGAGGQGTYAPPQPAYDASKYTPVAYIPATPSYGGAAGGDLASLFANNQIVSQALGQTNTQGQENVQVGGAQTNVGQNANTINVGQTNNQGGAGGQGTYTPPQPAYDPSTHGFAAFIDNKVLANLLSQANQQGQSSVQVGGAQTNFGDNRNEVNVGQTNNQPARDAEEQSYRKA